jgi:hypothetical protein
MSSLGGSGVLSDIDVLRGSTQGNRGTARYAKTKLGKI